MICPPPSKPLCSAPYPAEWSQSDLEGEDERDDRRRRDGAPELQVEGREVLLQDVRVRF